MHYRNDRVDELAWWGKEAGPFSRLARDGSGEGDGRWREEPDFEGHRQRRLAEAARTEEGDENGESVDDEAASDRRVQRFERRRTLIGNEGRAVGEREDALTNRTDSEGFAIFDPRVFGMVGALVGSSTTNNLQVRSQNGQLN
eukprot:SAG31_NODE_1613_length_7743_cov_5.584903_9_plen_143_part_00